MYREETTSNQQNYKNVSLMSLTADQAKIQINILINTNIIQRLNLLIALPNDTHRYRYNPSKQLSKLLLKKCSSYYITMSNKRSNKNTTIPKALASSLEAELKHDWDEYDERYWVSKNKFWEFRDEYDELQNSQRNPVSVELHIIVEIKRNC